MPYRLMNEYTVAVLGYDAVGDEDVMDPLGRGPAVWLQQLDPRKPLRHATHVDISVPHDADEPASRRHSSRRRSPGGRFARARVVDARRSGGQQGRHRDLDRPRLMDLAEPRQV